MTSWNINQKDLNAGKALGAYDSPAPAGAGFYVVINETWKPAWRELAADRVLVVLWEFETLSDGQAGFQVLLDR